jgi:4-diphosphocytidyl-2C-methyl-D-erythritol kinase
MFVTHLQVIDLGDDMQFSKLPAGATADKLVCSDPTIPHDDSNLVIKVRQHLQQRQQQQW